MIVQMISKKGVKLFGERYYFVMLKKFKQTNGGVVGRKPFFTPQDDTYVTPEENKKTLESINLIKEQR